jgi:hypothetical protein
MSIRKLPIKPCIKIAVKPCIKEPVAVNFDFRLKWFFNLYI